MVGLKTNALKTNQALVQWLGSFDIELIDFCLIFGLDASANLIITSEVSPDGMRMKQYGRDSLDKDLFRTGKTHEEILDRWAHLNCLIKEGKK